MNTNTAGMSVAQISAMKEWKNLTPKAKQVLSVYFNDVDHNLTDAVALHHPNLLPDVQRQVAENLMANPNVRTIVDLFFNRKQETYFLDL